jgi:hypothetical protein
MPERKDTMAKTKAERGEIRKKAWAAIHETSKRVRAEEGMVKVTKMTFGRNPDRGNCIVLWLQGEDSNGELMIISTPVDGTEGLTYN